MPVRPNGERCPADVAANPVLVAKKAAAKLKRLTHRVVANVVSKAANPAAAKLTFERRQEIAKKAAATRWANGSYANRQIRLAFVVIVSVLGTAQASEMTLEERLARFDLFNDCRPMYVAMETLPLDAKQIGLTEYSLRAAIEGRLRTARLFDDEASPFLYLNVHVVGRAFSITLSYIKGVCDPASAECFGASTWERRTTGTHGNDAGSIRSSVSEKMDIFILEYMRVNEEACSRQ